MKYLVLFCLGMSVLTSAAVASEPVDCSALEDPDERLACFDARFPAAEPVESPAVEAPVSETAEAAEKDVISSDPTTTAPEAEVEASEAAATAATEAAPPAAEVAEEKPKTFFGDAKVDLTTTIRAIRTGDKQKMVFLLDNEEIWMQSSPRLLPFEEGDTVNIKNALLGGYFMRSTKGVSTRVKRIR